LTKNPKPIFDHQYENKIHPVRLPCLVVSWKTTKVEVAKSGDIGFVRGTYELTMNDTSGKPVNDRGKYLEVWEEQADGSGFTCGLSDI
jgi:hypothetical protein